MDEETIKLGVNATPQFIGALTEMVWAQIGLFRPVVDFLSLQLTIRRDSQPGSRILCKVSKRHCCDRVVIVATILMG